MLTFLFILHITLWLVIGDVGERSTEITTLDEDYKKSLREIRFLLEDINKTIEELPYTDVNARRSAVVEAAIDGSSAVDCSCSTLRLPERHFNYVNNLLRTYGRRRAQSSTNTVASVRDVAKKIIRQADEKPKSLPPSSPSITTTTAITTTTNIDDLMYTSPLDLRYLYSTDESWIDTRDEHHTQHTPEIPVASTTTPEEHPTPPTPRAEPPMNTFSEFLIEAAVLVADKEYFELKALVDGFCRKIQYAEQHQQMDVFGAMFVRFATYLAEEVLPHRSVDVLKAEAGVVRNALIYRQQVLSPDLNHLIDKFDRLYYGDHNGILRTAYAKLKEAGEEQHIELAKYFWEKVFLDPFMMTTRENRIELKELFDAYVLKYHGPYSFQFRRAKGGRVPPETEDTRGRRRKSIYLYNFTDFQANLRKFWFM